MKNLALLTLLVLVAPFGKKRLIMSKAKQDKI